MIGLLVVIVVLVVLVVLLGVGVLAAQRAVRPRPKRRVAVIACDQETITLAASDQTRAPGVYRAYYGAHDGISVLIGAIVEEAPDHVVRELAEVKAQRPHAGDSLLWSGYLIDQPDALPIPVDVVTIPGVDSNEPAWLYEVENASVWAIHVHGIHSDRRAILRAVPHTLREGMTSLVIPYRGDAEDTSRRPASFGQTEWQDLNAAIAFARARGAERIVLVGWSMGATICLLAAARSEHKQLIERLLLICPALDWIAALKAGAAKAGLPTLFGAAAAFALTTPGLAQLSGLPRRLERRSLRPPLPRGLPVLLIHSTGDRDIPLAASRAFMERYPDDVRLAEFPPCPHGMELNRDPDRFEAEVSAFLGARVNP